MDFFSVFIVDLGKINCQTKNRGQTLYLMGANGCDLLENDWFRYHGTVDISSCSGITERMRPWRVLWSISYGLKRGVLIPF